MQKLTVLNTREKKKFLEILKKNYGYENKIKQVILLDKEKKIFFLTQDIAMISKDQEKALRIDKAGLYIGRIEPEGIRLSMEGSQIIGPYAKKNVLEINKENLEPWVKGEDLILNHEEMIKTGKNKGFFIIKHKKDYLGCAKIKEEKAHNLITKTRRLKNLNQ